MIDIGANLTHSCFQDCLDQTLADALKEGVEHIVVTGSDCQSSQSARALSETRTMLTFTAGIHPHNAGNISSEERETLQNLWRDQRCVAVGECGLDYHRMHQTRERQRACLIAQLEASEAYHLPLFLHLRAADQELIELLDHYAAERAKVVHCYTSGRDTLRQLLDRGVMIGLTGWLCDPRRNQQLLDCLAYLPIDRIMIESDAPWLIPRTIPGFRKIKYNQPRFLPYILDELAAQKKVPREPLNQQLRANTGALFGDLVLAQQPL